MLPTVVAISEANRDHVCVATEAREVHCWGINDLGQLGPDGPPMRSTTPVRITGLP
jgi:alpha-tubulin suppressor-like RCC1 family protein